MCQLSRCQPVVADRLMKAALAKPIVSQLPNGNGSQFGVIAVLRATLAASVATINWRRLKGQAHSRTNG